MKNKPKNKKINFLNNEPSAKKRNKSDSQAFKDAEAKLLRVVFNSQPASHDFREKLKNAIIEKRNKQQVIMKKPVFNFDSIKDKFIPKRLTSVVVISSMLVIAVMASYFVYPIFSGTGNLDGFSKLLIDPVFAESNFSVEATDSDNLGIEDASVFIIKSKDDIDDPNLLKENIKLNPDVEFDFEVVNSKEFKVIPKKILEQKVVYNVQIYSAYINSEGVTVERDYSWAFQVKDEFKIYGSLPGDKRGGVPLNSGIEIYFSHEDYFDYEKYISIKPNVEGRFEKHGRTLSFVPNKLMSGTIYTVKVDKNLPLENSNERLSEDYVFQFETDDKQKQGYIYDRIYLQQDSYEFSAEQTPFFKIYQNGYKGVDVTVYNLGGVDNYLNYLNKKNKQPAWAKYNYRSKIFDLGQAPKVMSGYVDIQGTNYSNSYIVLPDSLEQGFYALEINVKEGKKIQTFFQVTDIATYINISETNSLVWLKDLQTGRSLSGAKVSFMGNDKIYSSDNQGLVVFDGGDISEYKNIMKISTGSKEAVYFVNKDNRYFTEDDYWVILEKDRSVYKKNDKVNFWGFIKNRDSESLEDKELKIKLTNSSGYYDYYRMEEIIIDETVVKLDSNGAISASLDLKDLKSGYYYASLTLDGKFIEGIYIDVKDYTKPEYKIDLTPDKFAVVAGDEINLNVSASFFEGTPVPYLDLRSYAGVIRTDSEGKTSFKISTNFKECSTYCDFVRYEYFEVKPDLAELGEINGQTRVFVANFDTLSEPSIKKSEDGKMAVKTQFKKVDLNKINYNNGNIYSDYWGDIRSYVDYRAEVYEVGYKKEESGTYYDFINKTTHKTYRYDSYSNLISEFSGNTGESGIDMHYLNISEDKNYKVKIFAKDTRGREFFTTTYYYNNHYDYYDYGYDYYRLQITDKEATLEKPINNYSVGEKVKINFSKNEKKLDDSSPGSYLYIKMHRGLKNYEISSESEYNFTFSEEDVPNVSLLGVWFDGKTFHEASNYYSFNFGGTGLDIRLNSKDRELDIDISSDKESYEPGEEVRLSVSIKDKNGRAVRSSFNAFLVDEAIYKIREDYSDILSSLYQSVFSGKVFSYSSHQLPNFLNSGAEGGAGCFLAGTKITMADGLIKNIEDIEVGDEILTYTAPGDMSKVTGKVLETFRHIVPGYLIINDSIKVTPEHRAYINDGWQMIGESKVGDLLLDENGIYVRIESIEKIDKPVKVFNFHVENYHSYFANGIYVHNDKGGTREDFKDTALFFSGQTNSNGRGEVVFTLPDNITSWRINARAVSNDLYAGQSSININVSKPVFVLDTFANEYLSSDKPVVKLRVFGDSVEKGDDVEYIFNANDLGVVSQTASLQAFTAAYFGIDKLKEGTYPLTYAARTATGSDVVKKNVNIIKSRLTREYTDFYNLDVNTKLDYVPQDRFSLIFSDESQGKYYQELSNLAWSWGNRVDQKLSRILSERYKEIYFGDEIHKGQSVDLSVYQMNNGGIALLPYAEADFELSAKISALVPDFFDQDALKSYFYRIFNEKNISEDEVSISLYGLASLGEPVLYPIQKMASRDDLSVKNKLYIGLAADKLGDKELAREILNKILSETGEEFESMARIKSSDNYDEILSLTSLAANLSAGVGSDTAEGLWNYVEKNHSKEFLLNLEKLLYIKQNLTQLKPRPVSFVLELRGERIEKELKKGRTFKLSITPQEYDSLKILNKDGEVGLVVSYHEDPNKLQDDTQLSNYVSIDKKYFVGGVETKTFKENDVVEVRLYPSISEGSIGGSYSITDFLPSGLNIINNTFTNSDIDYNNCTIYPYNDDSNIMETSIYGKQIGGGCSYLNYFARVVSLGDYLVEPAVIQSLYSNDIVNYSKEDRIIIEHVD